MLNVLNLIKMDTSRRIFDNSANFFTYSDHIPIFKNTFQKFTNIIFFLS